MKRKLYFQLGRAGDILNVLPLCEREYAKTGMRPLLMVCEQFAGMLEGVSYVDSMAWRGEFEDIAPALAEAERIAASDNLELVCTQIYGRGLACMETCTSFMRESWERDPGAPAWGSLPLTFDRRDAAVEVSVKRQLLRGHTGPYVVTALSGTSSPFEHGAKLKAELCARLEPKGVKVVDISGFLAPRFYDLLGLLEGANHLVTVDSGVLHLAAAVPKLSVIAFITREPSKWHGSPWRPQHTARFFYDEAPDCIREVVRCAGLARADLRPNIVHVWSHFANGHDSETDRRMKFAHSTWEPEYRTGRWINAEFTKLHAFRHSGDVGDPRPVPYLRDMIIHAVRHARDHKDIIAYTNADVCFVPGLSGQIYDVTARTGAAYTHRYDFYKPFERPLRNEAAVARGHWYPGSDAFFFTVEWWLEHQHEFPDMVIGREHVDEVLRQMIKRHNGLEIPASIYHEKHASFWEHFGNRDTNPGNLHNRVLARRWFLKTGYGPDDPMWWRIPAA
jgi:hypothetical protein